MGKLIKPTGEIIEVQPANGEDFTCEELNKLVNGHFEMMELPDKSGWMIINEEGKLKNLPFNDLATAIYNAHDYICGNCLLCAWDEVK